MVKLELDKKEIIPEQDLKKKVAYAARIVEVFPSTREGKRLESIDFNDAEAIRVQIENVTGILRGQSGMVFKPQEYARFTQAYGGRTAEDLIGEPVISVYTEDWGQMICGLIPVARLREPVISK